MAARVKEIREWLEDGASIGATHVIVCCDTYDYTDYPSYVMPNESVVACVRNKSCYPMTKIMEVYNLSMDIERQLQERRAWNL